MNNQKNGSSTTNVISTHASNEKGSEWLKESWAYKCLSFGRLLKDKGCELILHPPLHVWVIPLGHDNVQWRHSLVRANYNTRYERCNFGVRYAHFDALLSNRCRNFPTILLDSCSFKPLVSSQGGPLGLYIPSQWCEILHTILNHIPLLYPSILLH